MIEKICPFCKEIFDGEFMKDHIGIKHLGLEAGAFQSMKDELVTLKTFDCKKCEENFESESDLKIHGNFAHPVFKFGCEVCKKSFISERSLTVHKKVLHEKLFKYQRTVLKSKSPIVIKILDP